MFPLREFSTIGLEDLSAESEPVKRRPVKRNLFGIPTPEKQATDFQNQENRLDGENTTKRFIEKWGFDPANSTPVDNVKYEWIPIERKEDAPGYYFKTYSTCKSRPVNNPRRERSNNSPYYYSRQHILHRPLKRGYNSRAQDDEENDCNSDVHNWEKIVDSKSQFATPKPLRSSSPSPSSQNLDASSSSNSNSNNSLTCSTLGFRSRSVSNTSSSGFTSVTNDSLKQQTMNDHFQVKKPRCLNMNKGLPRT